MKVRMLILFILLFNITVLAQEAQFRGSERNGYFPDTDLMKKWPKEGPEMIMKVEDLGAGFSSPIYHDGIIYITGKKTDSDYLSAVDMKGNVIYQVKYGQSWSSSYPDTRSTPTLEKDRLYVTSGSGQVACINAKDGTIIWTVDANSIYEGEPYRWGIAESPLIIDNKVIYTTGGNKASVIALDKENGKEIWKAKSLGGERAFVSPVIYENDGKRLIIAVTSNDVIGILPENGDILWNYKYSAPPGGLERRAKIIINSPIFKGNEMFISKGYDMYGVMLVIAPDGKSVTEKWRTEVMDTHHGHYVQVGDYIYGSNWISNSQGNWICLDWDSGNVMYEDEWITKGSIIYADGLLYCWEERSGNLALVKPNPKKFDIISSFKIEHGTGPHWAHPYIADKKLLLRHGEVLMVFDIAAN